MATPDVPDDLIAVPDDLSPVGSDTALQAAQVHNEVPDDLQAAPAAQPPQSPGFFGTIQDDLKSAVDAVKSDWGELPDLESDARALLPGAVVSGAKAVASGAFNAIAPVVDAADRIAGTLAAKVVDPLANFIDTQVGADHSSLVDAANQRQIENGSVKSLTELSFKNIFPVRLMEDFVMPGTDQIVTKGGQVVTDTGQALDSPTLKEAGKLLQYVAPAAGLAAGIMAFDALPGSFVRFGELTDTGIAADKAGTLESSFAGQLQEGQKALASFKAGPVELGSTNFGTVGIKAAQAASKLSVAFDATTVGQGIQKFTTASAYPIVNQAMDTLGLRRNQNESYMGQFANSANAQAKKFGLDLSDPEVRQGLQDAFDNPSTFNESKYSSKVSAEAANGMYDYLNGELQAAVKNATENGIEIPEKEFYSKEDYVNKLQSNIENLDMQIAQKSSPELIAERASIQRELSNIPEDAVFSERYAPRSPNPDALQAMRSAEVVQNATKLRQLDEYNAVLEDSEAGRQIVQDMGLRGSGSTTGSFSKFRDLENTAGMNAKIQETLGVKNFFSDDIVGAYADKINDINKSVMEKNYVQAIKDQFVTSPEELLLKKTDADANIAASLETGKVVNPVDMRMSLLNGKNTVSFQDLPASLRSKLSRLGTLSPDLEGIEGLRVPGDIADRMTETLSPQRMQFLQASAVSAQNLFKAALTMNPGFYIRNWFQSSIMGGAAGVGIADNVKAFMAMVKDSGDWAKYSDEFDSLRRGMGSYGRIEQELSTVQRLRKVAEVNATRADFVGDSAMKRLWYEFRQMGSTENWKGWVNDLKTNGVDAVRDNPVYRVAGNIGKGGEDIPQMAYYSKLRDAGYEPEMAMSKVNKQFLNFDNTRAATKSLSKYFPFANHAIKNAEVTMNILAQSPRSALMYGRNGAFQRAVENWAGWDPDQAQRTRDAMGPWMQDDILLTVMPGTKDLLAHQDLLRDVINTVYSGAPARSQLLFSLPSNFNALSMFDPTKLDSMAGPLVKAGIALLGVDPFTGKSLQSTDTYNGWIQRLSVAGDQFLNPLIPRTAIGAVSGILDKLHPVWAQNVARAGFSEDTSNLLNQDPRALRAEKETQKAIVKASTLWRGTYTQADDDMMWRIIAKQNASKEAIQSYLSDYKTGRAGEQALKNAQMVKIKDNEAIQQMVNVRDDYEQMLKKTNAPAWHINYQNAPQKGTASVQSPSGGQQ